MKKSLLLAGALVALLTSCGNNKCNCNCSCKECGCSKTEGAAPVADTKRGEYEIADKAQADMSKYTPDADGYITLFDGETLGDWRGYGKDEAPAQYMWLSW